MLPPTSLSELERSLDSEGTSRLIDRCLQGDERAWARFVDAYKNLVYAVIRRSPRTKGEEADLFQSVWIDIYRELPNLRSHQALTSWIATLTRHKCYHWGQRAIHLHHSPWSEERARTLLDPAQGADEMLEQLERQQQLRELVRELEPRCRTLLELLFLSDPPLPYQRVADRLGLAVGSIGSLRANCLQRIRDRLNELGRLPRNHDSGD